METVTLKRGRDKPVRQRHPWIFSGAIAQLPQGANDGDLVRVADARGEPLAVGYLNRRSQIQVRLLHWLDDVRQESPSVDDTLGDDFWRARLAASIARRSALAADDDTTAYRLVNGESDELPGLIVDRYGEHLVLQAGTLGIDRRKARLASMLLDLTDSRSVIERSDLAVRRREGLSEAVGTLAGDPPAGAVNVCEHGLRFAVDLLHGQKTGFYTDQRDNRRRVARYCAGARVLNGFAYTGAFAVHALARGAAHVTNIDSSFSALEAGEVNLRLNGFNPDAQSESLAGDLFQVLRDWHEQEPAGGRFDVIILDPPKFATTKGSVDRALRGYKEINRLALGLLKPGGILATFSCSGLVSADLFQKVIFGAALDAGRAVQIVEWLQQASDHPVLLSFPEGAYLKGLICRVL